MTEHNIRITVAYDGTNYVGWQRQPENKGISIQQRLEEAASEMLGHAVTINGSGRTDAGVHAFGQVANFICDKPVPVDKMCSILNNILPEDIRVMKASIESPDFHARFTPHMKCYRYIIEQEKRVSPFAPHYSWQVGEMLDICAMHNAALALVGEHDFRNFTLSGVSATNFVRRISNVEIYEPFQMEAVFPWQQLNSPLVIDVVGNGFLYKMVRLIVARLVAIGQGKLPSRAMLGYLNGEVTENIPPAPAQGLFLASVGYEHDEDLSLGGGDEDITMVNVIF